MKEVSNMDLLAELVGRKSAKALDARPLTELFGFSKPRQMQLCEERAAYAVHPKLAAAKELLARCMLERMKSGDAEALDSPAAAKAFLCSKIGHLEHESFWCLWLDTQRRLVAAEEIFRGTLAKAVVYPREVVKRALLHNAGAVIFAHNHPSGTPTPSRDDEIMTNTLKSALELMDVKVLDHLVVVGNNTVSFVEKGLL